MFDMNRRSFIKATGAAAAVSAVAASVAMADEKPAGVTADDKWSFEIAPAPIPEDQIVDVKSADVVVVGAGMSGLVSAVSCAENGLSVVLLTASTASVSRGGSNNAVYSKVMEEMDLPRLNPEWYRTQYMINAGNFKPALWYKYYNNSEEAMNWLIDKARAANLIVTVESGTDYPAGDIMETPAGAHSFHASEDELETGVGTGEPNIANELVRLLTDELGVAIDWSTKAEQLVKDGDRVVGVVASNANGYVKYLGAKAVILATGDFTRDRDMVARYAPEILPICWNLGAEPDYDAYMVVGGLMPGDGQKMELWAGGAWQIAPNVIMLGRPNLPADGPYMSHSGLMVDANGERFMNEDVLGGVACATIMHNPANTAYCIWSANRAQALMDALGGVGKPNAVHGVKFESAEEFQATWDNDTYGFGIKKTDTLEELVEALGLPAATLQTVARYNELCAAGADTDFYKDPAKMIPIEEGPFYGCAYTPMMLCSLGGCRSNANLQVLDANDNPIPGLFHVGSMIGDFYSGVYTFAMEGVNYGATCVTLPYVLGKELGSGKFDA